jgi:hypothetical protein
VPRSLDNSLTSSAHLVRRRPAASLTSNGRPSTGRAGCPPARCCHRCCPQLQPRLPHCQGRSLEFPWPGTAPTWTLAPSFPASPRQSPSIPRRRLSTWHGSGTPSGASTTLHPPPSETVSQEGDCTDQETTGHQDKPDKHPAPRCLLSLYIVPRRLGFQEGGQHPTAVAENSMKPPAIRARRLRDTAAIIPPLARMVSPATARERNSGLRVTAGITVTARAPQGRP